ncbi:MAG: hypothetical protein KKB90_06420 [Actinobacteria bacterium]|nr:hypothetical protein [Actinomycetota bacterium]MCG2818467.1 hypothetical protein [Actinomycetes bacterium]MBU4179457.1 hypothetical protein [Actinomycetota bacterium]MBU4218582.1 hypothetical protein [Actinomycetota bacterium]MBU4391594.1 hypothetical protein [Actinomycetota bacterium]
MEDSPEDGRSDVKQGAGGGARFGLLLVLLAAVATSVVCAVYLVKASNDRLTLSRGLLDVMVGSPGESIYYLRKSDPGGDILEQAFSVVRKDNDEEFSRTAASISEKLMGDDQVEFFTSRNQYGIDNAEILGYLAGCLKAIGPPESDIPYPVTDTGSPYEGSAETIYDLEVNRVAGSGK